MKTTSEVVVSGVQVGEFPFVWEKVSPLLEEALKYSGGRFSVKTVRDLLINGSMQLWVATNGDDTVYFAAITQLITWPTGLYVCDIFLLGGVEHKKWLGPLEDFIAAWAKAQGCHSMQLVGRPGWEKALKNWGKCSVMLDRDLYQDKGESHE